MKSPTLNLKKIKHFDGSLDKLKLQGISTDLLRDLFSTVIILNSTKNDDEIKHLKNYFIIRLITILESYFTDWVIKLIDVYELPIHDLFDEPYVKIPLSRLDDIKMGKITKGKIIATSFNFQEISEINKVFSVLLVPDFVNKLKKFEFIDSFEKNKFRENWDVFFELFKVRHEIVHNLSYEIKYTKKEINEIHTASQLFIMMIEKIFAYVLFQARPEKLKTENKFLYDWANPTKTK